MLENGYGINRIIFMYVQVYVSYLCMYVSMHVFILVNAYMYAEYACELCSYMHV